jgi:hypothetical protein
MSHVDLDVHLQLTTNPILKEPPKRTQAAWPNYVGNNAIMVGKAYGINNEVQLIAHH